MHPREDAIYLIKDRESLLRVVEEPERDRVEEEDPNVARTGFRSGLAERVDDRVGASPFVPSRRPKHRLLDLRQRDGNPLLECPADDVVWGLFLLEELTKRVGTVHGIRNESSRFPDEGCPGS